MGRERTVQLVVGALCVLALVAVFLVLGGGEIDETGWRVIAIALTGAIYLLLGLAGNALRESHEPWSWLGAIAVALCVAGGISAVLLWLVIGDHDGDAEESLAKLAGALALFAVVTSHGSLLMRHSDERTDMGRAVRLGTLGCGLVLAMLLTVILFDDHGSNEFESWSRVLAVFGILYLLGAVVAPLLRLAEPKPDAG